jgi:hypothetical protein
VICSSSCPSSSPKPSWATFKSTASPFWLPSSALTSARHRLRAPIRGLLTGDDVKAFMAAQENNNNNNNVVADSSQRVVQDGTGQSEFGLEVTLRYGDSGDDEDSSSGVVSTIAVADCFICVGRSQRLCFRLVRQKKTQGGT